MANDKKTGSPEEIQSKDTLPEKLEPAKVPAFSLERLRQDCYQLFGITVSTFDGATFGLTGEYTVEEAKKVIENQLNKPLFQNKKKEVK